MAATARTLEDPEMAEEPFMPPEAMEPERRRQPLDAPAEADDHGKGKFRFRTKTGPSLFERMTGTGRARRDSDDELDYGEEAEATSPAPKSDAQPQLSGLEPTEPQSPQRQSDDDMLDIPAFLRRQAN